MVMENVITNGAVVVLDGMLPPAVPNVINAENVQLIVMVMEDVEKINVVALQDGMILLVVPNKSHHPNSNVSENHHTIQMYAVVMVNVLDQTTVLVSKDGREDPVVDHRSNAFANHHTIQRYVVNMENVLVKMNVAVKKVGSAPSAAQITRLHHGNVGVKVPKMMMDVVDTENVLERTNVIVMMGGMVNDAEKE